MRAAVIDFETTGLLKSAPHPELQPYITEIACVIINERFEELGSFVTRLNPDIDPNKWEEGAIKTTGIGPDDVAKEPTYFMKHHDFANFVLGCDTWGGFNCPFDQQVLRWELIRNGFECAFPWPPATFDVMRRSARKIEMQGRNGLKNPKLGEAYKHFTGKEMPNAHEALADVRHTIDVWRHL